MLFSDSIYKMIFNKPYDLKKKCYIKKIGQKTEVEKSIKIFERMGQQKLIFFFLKYENIIIKVLN